MLGPLVTLALAVGAPASEPWRYDLEVEPDRLSVRARFPAGSGRGLEVGVPELAEGLTLDTDCNKGCDIRYHITLARAEAEGAAEARAKMWTARLGPLLARPQAARDTQVELRVRASKGADFAAGLPRQGEAYVTRSAHVARLPFVAFGQLWRRRISVPGGALDVVAPARGLDLAPPDIAAWVTESAGSLARYLGAFPAPDTLVIVVPSGREGVPFGSAHGFGATVVRVFVGRHARKQHLARDWKLRHELSHLTLANLHPRHAWLEEGLATYVEAVLEAKLGKATPEEMFESLADGFPRGAPRGDPLDGTRRWGETYWGGALFWFVVDLELRAATGGASGLPEALARVTRAQGSMRVGWSAEHLVQVMDEGLPRPVVAPLYALWGQRGTTVDVDALWRKAGVRTKPRLSFDRSAAWAEYRSAIAAPWPPPSSRSSRSSRAGATRSRSR